MQDGETITVLYEAVEELSQEINWTDRDTGKTSKFAVVNMKVPIKLASGTRGFVLVRKPVFSDIAQKFSDAGFPHELLYTAPVRSRRRR